MIYSTSEIQSEMGKKHHFSYCYKKTLGEVHILVYVHFFTTKMVYNKWNVKSLL